jgi:predicted enzyme related to lactoylglutathione lyase
MARVTGIGGVFLRARDPKALAAWYGRHLGIEINAYNAATMRWTDEIPAGTGVTAWSTFPQDTTYFGPGNQPVMVNYRVDALDGLLKKLSTAGVEIDPKRENFAYGRFAWIVDPEGNRLELWQPVAMTKKLQDEFSG